MTAQTQPQPSPWKRFYNSFRGKVIILLMVVLAISAVVLSPTIFKGATPPTAAVTPTNFDHIVIIAMENTPYESVFGSGTLSTCPTGSAPFLCSMLPYSSTVPNMNNYGATSADANDFNGCSAACYVGFMMGYTYGVSDGYSFSSISGNPQLVNSLAAAGLTWQAYCAEGCPRANDHFPFPLSGSSNTFTSSSVTTSTLIGVANSAAPPNLLWYTPTDSENMHDVSVSVGDSYLKSFLVGSGSITSPAGGSLLASNLFTNTSFHTMLYLWWDECNGINGACDSNNDAANLMYGTPVKKGYVSPDTTGIDEYASLYTLEKNWGISPLAQGDKAAQANNYQISDIFTTTAPAPLSASFTFSPSAPVTGQPVTFTATASGGTAPYTFTWTFGDTTGATGQTATHAYTAVGSYVVGLSVKDSAGSIATSSLGITVTAATTLSVTFTYSPASPNTGQVVNFAATGTGGTSPYTFTWAFGDGGTGTGQTVAHTYTTAGAFTATVTIKDASNATATSAQGITVTTVSTSGNFGACADLPQGWNCGNASGEGGTASATITNGIAIMSLSNVGGNDNAYAYATTQKGTFPWTPCTAPASGVIPAGLTSVSTTFTPTALPTSGAGSRYHIFIALYYWLPNGPVSAGGSTYQCLDTQSRVQNVGGVFTAVGETETYNPGDSFGWDQVTLGAVTTGTAYTLTANVAAQCQGDFAAWGIPASTPCELAGIEIGIEGFQLNQLGVSFTTVSLTTTAPSPSFTLTASPSSVSVPVATVGTSTISVVPQNGFTGTVAFTVSTSSPNLSCAVASSVLSCSSSIAGSYTATVTGTSGSLTSSVTVAFTVTGPPSFTLSASPSSVSVLVGAQGTTTITVNPLNGFTGAVSFTATSSAGLTCTMSGSTLSCSSSTAGSYSATVTGTSGTLTAQVAVSYTVTTSSGNGKYILTFQGFDWDGGHEHSVVVNGHTVAQLPSSDSPQNAQIYVTFTVNITSRVVQGSNTLSFTDAGFDCGVVDSVRDLVITSGTSTVYSNATVEPLSCAIPLLTYKFTTVTVPPGFTLSANPSTITMFTNQTKTSTIVVTAVGGFTGTITYSTAVNSTSLSCTLAGQALSCTSMIGGNYLATVIGTSGTLTSSTSVTFHVTQPSPIVVTVTTGFTVSFTTSISGGVAPYTCSWSFGDGSTGSGCSVTHTYSGPGSYTVTLVVTDSIGDRVTTTLTVTL
jgi:PKD repeat protein